MGFSNWNEENCIVKNSVICGNIESINISWLPWNPKEYRNDTQPNRLRIDQLELL